MSIGFFIVGGLIFGVYMYFTLWNIFYSSKKQREENYPTLGDLNRSDVTDMDGMGNFSRFPTDDIKIEKRKIKKREYETLRRTKK